VDFTQVHWRPYKIQIQGNPTTYPEPDSNKESADESGDQRTGIKRTVMWNIINLRREMIKREEIELKHRMQLIISLRQNKL
jgi:hypothetical protein